MVRQEVPLRERIQIPVQISFHKGASRQGSVLYVCDISGREGNDCERW